MSRLPIQYADESNRSLVGRATDRGSHLHQFGCAPENLITLAHLSVSCAMSLVYSLGERASTRPPKSAMRACTTGSARASLISRLSVSMISAGVLFGAPMPAHALVSNPGTKSPTVGMSGSACRRAAEVTARGRSLPALMCSMEDGRLSNMTCTCPPMRSVSADGAPRYGTCSMLTPVIILNSSPVTCATEPLPAEAKLISPG